MHRRQQPDLALRLADRALTADGGRAPSRARDRRLAIALAGDNIRFDTIMPERIGARMGGTARAAAVALAGAAVTPARRLIIDVGMSEGNDTAFYLAKGFDVVGVEADPTLRRHLAQRFAEEIADGRLRILHRAAAARGGERARFRHDPVHQGHSSLARPGQADGELCDVLTIDWPELRAVAGVPYYLKLDIEGGEPAFLSSMAGEASPPPFLSVELTSPDPIRQMHALGYRHFRLINHEILGRVALPDPPLEGRYVPRPSTHHWSGPFGRELPGSRWFPLEEIVAIYDTLHRLWELETLITGWLDCHAALPEALA